MTELDPHDAISWYWTASTLTDPENPLLSTSPKLAKEQAALYSKALELDPYLTQAIYKLSFVSRLAGEPQKQKALLDRWEKINPDRQQPVPGPGKLGREGLRRDGQVRHGDRPRSPGPSPLAESDAIPPKFEPARPLDVKLATGDRWADRRGLQGRPRRDRQGSCPLRRGRRHLRRQRRRQARHLPGSGGRRPQGPARRLAAEPGRRQFPGGRGGVRLAARPGQPRASPPPTSTPTARSTSSSPAWARTGCSAIKDGKAFEDQTQSLKTIGPPAISLMARWLDLDQDGDLDLYVVNYCAAEHADKAFLADKPPPPGLANSVYRNDGQPEPIPGSPAPAWAPLAVAWENVKSKSGLSLALVPWTGMEALLGGEAPHTGIAALDLDGDRDLDLVLSADGSAPLAVLNDRLGNFHEVVLKDLATRAARLGTARHGPRPGRPRRPGGPLDSRQATAPCATRTERTDGRTRPGSRSSRLRPTLEAWRAAIAADLDLDGVPDLLGLPAADAKPRREARPHWSGLGTRASG